MKNILYFILGIFLVVGISATTVEVMTVKPAIPKQVVVINTTAYDVKKEILKYHSQGYIVKSITCSYSNKYSRYDSVLFIVMEKY